MPISRFLRRTAILPALLLSVACSDNIFRLRWSSDPDTALVYSLARPELNLESGFDFVNRTAVEIQAPGATGTWDFVLDTQGGQLVMVPPGVYGIPGDSRITVLEGLRFADVFEAPEDTLVYTGTEPVPVEMGNTYVFQTHRSRDQFGQLCRFFAKMEPIELDVQLGTLLFVFDRNPLCEGLDLIPPEERN
jgi:hypothetical protein